MSEVRVAVASDVPDIVNVHIEAFPGFFLTILGERFLHAMYRSFVLEEDGVCSVYEHEGRLLGFVVGTMQPTNFYSRLLKKKWFIFIWAGTGALLRHPIMVGRKFFGALFYRGDALDLAGDPALLSSIGVSPKAAGQGAGTKLVEHFFHIANGRGVGAIYLLTDAQSNEKVNAFYLRLGFELESVITKSDDRVMNRYLRRLD